MTDTEMLTTAIEYVKTMQHYETRLQFLLGKAIDGGALQYTCTIDNCEDYANFVCETIKSSKVNPDGNIEHLCHTSVNMITESNFMETGLQIVSIKSVQKGSS